MAANDVFLPFTFSPMSYKRFFLYGPLLLLTLGLQAQPKYEFRGVWVATVNNIDWPTKGASPDTQLSSRSGRCSR